MGLLEQVDGVKFGPESGSWQGLGDALAAATEHFPYPGNIIGADNDHVMSALTVAASELGTFLRPDDEHAMSFLTDAWDGRKRKFAHATKHSGSIEIPRPCLNIIGATTPSWLQRNMPDTLIRDGLLSRVVFVYAEKKRHFISLPSRTVRSSEFTDMGKRLVEDLNVIGKLIGPYNFCREVERENGWMDAWYSNHHTGRAFHMASDRYAGYLARKQTHLVKLAMVLAASKRDDLLIYQEDLEEADLILLDAERSMIKVFESVGVVDEAKHIAELLQFVRAYKWLPANELYRCVHNIMSEKDFKQALRLAIEGEALTVVTKDNVRGVSLKNQTVH